MSKHRVREFYLVTESVPGESRAQIQKLHGSNFRGKKYTVKFCEIFLAPISRNDSNKTSDTSSDDEISVNKDMDNENEIPVVAPNNIERPQRIRHPPDRLETDEIRSIPQQS